MLQHSNSLFEKWKSREINCNNWCVKEENFHSLPSEEERIKLYPSSPEIYRTKLPLKHCKFIYDERELDSAQLYFNQDLIDFYFMRTDYLPSFPDSEKIKVSGSSSFRSFFYEDKIIKVSHDKKLLYSYQIERAIRISGYLNEYIREKDKVQILKESFGCYLADPQQPYGYIIRQIPASIINGQTTLVSIVSYVSDSLHGEKSLLETRLSGMSTADGIDHLKFVTSSIIKSFLKLYWDFGVCMELHQQNTLLELDASDNFTGRVFCRDLDGARVDFEKVFSLGLNFSLPSDKELLNYTFDTSKIERLKNEIAPEFKDSLYWNGLTIFAFRLYLMDSSIFMLNHFLKRYKKIDFDLNNYAIEFLNQEILRKSPTTFFTKRNST